MYMLYRRQISAQRWTRISENQQGPPTLHSHTHTGCENNNIIVITIIRLFINVVDTLLEWGDGAYLSPHLDNVQRHLPLILTVVIDLLTVNNVLMSPLSANTRVFLS